MAIFGTMILFGVVVVVVGWIIVTLVKVASEDN